LKVEGERNARSCVGDLVRGENQPNPVEELGEGGALNEVPLSTPPPNTPTSPALSTKEPGELGDR